MKMVKASFWSCKPTEQTLFESLSRCRYTWTGCSTDIETGVLFQQLNDWLQLTSFQYRTHNRQFQVTLYWSELWPPHSCLSHNLWPCGDLTELPHVSSCTETKTVDQIRPPPGGMHLKGFLKSKKKKQKSVNKLNKFCQKRLQIKEK